MSWDDPSGLRDHRGGSTAVEVLVGIASALTMVVILIGIIQAIVGFGR